MKKLYSWRPLPARKALILLFLRKRRAQGAKRGCAFE